MDWMEQEQERGITITAAATTCFWRDHRINIIDTPGPRRLHDRGRAHAARARRRGRGVLRRRRRRAAARDGVAPGRPLPRAAHRVHQQDATASAPIPSAASQQIRERLRGATRSRSSSRSGSRTSFAGVIDLIEMKAVVWDDETLGAKFDVDRRSRPSSRDDAPAARAAMIEAIAEVDDEIDGALPRRAPSSTPSESCAPRCAARPSRCKAVPVLCGAAFKNKGVQPLLDAVVDYLPSPVDIPPVRGHATRDGGSRSTRKADDDEPFAALAFKIMNDPFVGQLTFFRVYSGTLETGATVYNATKGKRERIGRLLRMHANKREDIKEIAAGNIAAAVGLRVTTTGDTLCDEKHADRARGDGRSRRRSSRIAIEPKTKADQDKLGVALAQARRRGPVVPRPHRRRDRPDHHLRHGRAAPRDHRRPPACASSRSRRTSASRRSPTARPSPRRPTRTGKYIRQTGGRGAVRPRRSCTSSRPSAARASSSRTRSSAASSRTSSSRRSRRASRGDASAACSPATRWSTSRSRSSTAATTTSTRRAMAFEIAGSMGVQEAARKAGPDPARADHEGRGRHPRGVHGRRHRRPERAPRAGSRHERAGRRQVDHRRGAARHDVRLLDRPAVDDPGPRDLHDAVLALRAGPDARRRVDRRAHAGRLQGSSKEEREATWPRRSSSETSRT